MTPKHITFLRPAPNPFTGNGTITSLRCDSKVYVEMTDDDVVFQRSGLKGEPRGDLISVPRSLCMIRWDGDIRDLAEGATEE